MEAGYKIEQVPGLGCCIIATRRFAVGEVVLLERPQLICKADDPLDMIKAFLALPLEEREEIVGTMFHIKDPALTVSATVQHQDPTCAKRLERLMKVAEVIHENYVTKTSIRPLPTVQTIFNMLSIANFNIHQWKDGSEEVSRVALLPLCSKAEHSCKPNCQYSSQNVAYKGYGAYIACRDIEVGDAVSYGYIDVGATRADRRTKLLRAKDFYCQCVRCASSELCLLSCLKLKGDPIVRESSDAEKLNVKMENVECNLAVIMQELDIKVRPSHFGRLISLAHDALEVCFPVHRNVITIYETLSTCYESIAVQEFNLGRPLDVIVSLRMMAAQCGLYAASLLECEVEGCRGCALGHSPAQHAMTNAFWAGMEIVRVYKKKHGIDLSAGQKNAGVLTPLPPAVDEVCMSGTQLNLPFSSMVDILRRYLPLTVSQYGKEDTDVVALAGVASFVPIEKVEGDVDRTVAFAKNLRKLTENQLQGSSPQKQPRVDHEVAMTELLALLDIEEAAAAATPKNKNKKKKKNKKNKDKS